MCGIVGAVSRRNIVPILVQGLQRLEYRGYDSCGLAAVRAIAQRHGGTVSAQAAPGAGCTVSVRWLAGML